MFLNFIFQLFKCIINLEIRNFWNLNLKRLNS